MELDQSDQRAKKHNWFVYQISTMRKQQNHRKNIDRALIEESRPVQDTLVKTYQDF